MRLTTFNSLPQELLLFISVYLDLDDLVNFAQVGQFHPAQQTSLIPNRLIIALDHSPRSPKYSG
jgi:hypothetical protein